MRQGLIGGICCVFLRGVLAVAPLRKFASPPLQSFEVLRQRFRQQNLKIQDEIGAVLDYGHPSHLHQPPFQRQPIYPVVHHPMALRILFPTAADGGDIQRLKGASSMNETDEIPLMGAGCVLMIDSGKGSIDQLFFIPPYSFPPRGDAPEEFLPLLLIRSLCRRLPPGIVHQEHPGQESQSHFSHFLSSTKILQESRGSERCLWTQERRVFRPISGLGLLILGY